jgi:hypothetical protein
MELFDPPEGEVSGWCARGVCRDFLAVIFGATAELAVRAAAR